MKHFRMSRSLTVLAIALLSLGVDRLPGDEKKPVAKPAENKPADKNPADAKKPNAKKKEAAAAEGNKQADAQIDMMAAQYEQQMQPMLQAELNFIRQNCQLKPKDRPKIKAAGEAGMKAAAKKLATSTMRPNFGAFMGGGRPKQSDYRALIATALVEPLEQALGREGLDRFIAQREKWLAHRKRAAILNTVARVDKELLLTAEQRAKLVETITAKWQPGWDGWLNFHSSWAYFPQDIDSLVIPCLDADQKVVWASVQKISFGWLSFGNFIQNGAEDTWWDGEPEKPAANKKQ